MLFEKPRICNIDTKYDLLTKKCLQDCSFKGTNDNDIVKICNDPNIAQWEGKVYLTFIDKDLFPYINIYNNIITYKVGNLESFRDFLLSITKKTICNKLISVNINILLNELFCFLKIITKYGLIHGNLHIDNLYINRYTYKFYIIDYSNAYIKTNNNSLQPNYKRTSFIGEYDTKKDFDYWDFFTLYLSLKYFFINNKYTTHYILTLEKLFKENVDDNTYNNYIQYIIAYQH